MTSEAKQREQTPRRPGRPRTYVEPRKRLTIELPVDLVTQLEEVAETSHRSLTYVIEAVLRESLTRSTTVRDAIHISSNVSDLLQVWDSLSPEKQRDQYEHVLRVAMVDDEENKRRIRTLEQKVNESEMQ